MLNYDAVAAMFDIAPSELDPDTIDFVNQRLHLTIQDIEDAFNNAQLDHIVLMAKWLREHVYLVAEYLGIENASVSELDDLAAGCSPIALYLLEIISASFEDAAKMMTELEVPEELIQLSMPTLTVRSTGDRNESGLARAL